METVEKVTGILRNHGMKITPQRLMIFKVLENNTSHPSAEEVFKRVKGFILRCLLPRSTKPWKLYGIWER